MNDWTELTGVESVPSPALLVDTQRVGRNIQGMMSIAHPTRLRPHLKTHKMAEIVRLQVDCGITKFKAATLAELELAAAAGAEDVLLAIQPVGPQLTRLAQAIRNFPNASLAAVIDNPQSASDVAQCCGDANHPFRLFIDVDCGMHRTGIKAGPELAVLTEHIAGLNGVRLDGFHVYDGHVHDAALEVRRTQVREIIANLIQVIALDPEATVVAGGSPTFGIWAEETEWECSPGTPLLWDVGYAESFPDLPFEIAACLLTRVISKPGADRLCLDLGHKAVAAENPLADRVRFPALPEATFVAQSEEHLVIGTERADDFQVGDAIVALPCHICPTVALHRLAHLVRDGQVTGETWTVTARDR